MKKTFFLALVIAMTLGACGGKKKHDNKPHTGSGSADHTPPPAGSGDGSAAPTP